MPEFALYIDGVFKNEIRILADRPDPAITSRKGVMWYPVARDAKPAIDDATQIATATVGLVNGVHTLGWTVRDKTQKEIDDTKTQQAGVIPYATLMMLFNHENRIRALESKGPITLAQFRTAVRERL